MGVEVLINWTDVTGANFQLFKYDLEYVISSDAVDVSSWGQGCYYCVADVEKLSEAIDIFNRIIKRAEENKGIVGANWLVETFGKATC